MGGFVFETCKNEIGFVAFDHNWNSIEDRIQNKIFRLLWVDDGCIENLDLLYRQKEDHVFAVRIRNLLNNPYLWVRYMN